MGTIKNGILGGFSGKVGTVVGASWKLYAHKQSPFNAAMSYTMLIVPAEWLGDKVHTYMGFISEDGKEVANSRFIMKLCMDR